MKIETQEKLFPFFLICVLALMVFLSSYFKEPHEKKIPYQTTKEIKNKRF